MSGVHSNSGHGYGSGRGRGRGGKAFHEKGKGSGRAGKGYHVGTKGHSTRPLRPNEFTSLALEDPSVEPVVTNLASYSYASKIGDCTDVLRSAWTARALLGRPRLPIDLSLERSLAGLQMANGGFALDRELVGVLGLPHAATALEYVGSDSAEVLATLCVLRTVAKYKPDCCGDLHDICDKARSFLNDSLGTNRLWDDVLSDLEAPTHEDLPGLEALRKIFGTSEDSAWPFFELWFRLCPDIARFQVRGSVFSTRAFVVDLASAPWSPYDVDASYPIMVKGGCLFVASLGFQPKDFQRQSSQLKAALIDEFWQKKDHFLNQLQLDELKVFYSAVPDAAEDALLCRGPLQACEQSGYQHGGYQVVEQFDYKGQETTCRIWSADWSAVEPSRFFEIKQAADLQGRVGEFKKLKFGVQAALGGIGGVIVATPDGSTDRDCLNSLQRFTVADLAHVGMEKVWSKLAAMLRHLISGTSNAGDGVWTLTLKKSRGIGAAVAMDLTSGAQIAGLEDMEARLNKVFESR